MGMAMFYLKARYPSAAEARAAADQALPYFEDIEKFENDWHEIRDDHVRSPKDRYDWLVARHPLAQEVIKKIYSAKDMDPNMNFLAHEIPDVEPGVVDFDLVVKDDILYLKSWGWQHSDWDPIVRWLKKHGAKKVAWGTSNNLGMEPGPKDWWPGAPMTPFDQIHV